MTVSWPTLTADLVYQQNIQGTPGSGATVTSHEDAGQESFHISRTSRLAEARRQHPGHPRHEPSATSSDFLILPELLAGHSTAGGGGIAESATAYTGPVTLNKSVRVKGRILSGDTWSALTEAVYASGCLTKLAHI